MVDALDVGQSTVSHHCRLLRRQVVGPEGLLHLQFRASLAGEEALQRVLAGNPEARTRNLFHPRSSWAYRRTRTPPAKA